ncbi:MAG: sodium-dependent transporter [Candidatus Gastranaerophilales bacterium]|nr:sodium-dependent transporter [Candidatus Gastranaerophilales bacterium]
MENKRPEWSSYLSFIIASVGSAVGLGNIWRFPYIMGQYGGAVFLITYLLIIALVCVIPLSVELATGKYYKGDPITIYNSINPKFKIFGFFCLITSILIPCFYFVVGGWILNYIWVFLGNNIPNDFSQYFTTLNASPLIPVILTLIYLLFSLLFPYIGLNKGIEKANNFMMPLFGIMLLILAIYALTLPGAKEGIEFMFKPDFSKFSSEMILAALGQALFTLSIGIGIMMTYGSYLKKDTNIIKSSYTLIFFDTIVAILAGVMIFPIVFTNHIEPTAGATLVFISLPQIFTTLPYARILAVLFFVLLFFAAVTSGISLLEGGISCFCDYFKMPRKKASLLLFFLIGIISIPASLSFGVLADFKIMDKTFFDLLDYLTSNILMPICTIAICLIVAWGAKHIQKEAFGEGIFAKLLSFVLKYILPWILICVLVMGLR